MPTQPLGKRTSPTVVAQESDVDMDEAFAQIRGYARDHNERLRIVAEKIASGALKPEQFSPKRRPRPGHPEWCNRCAEVGVM